MSAILISATPIELPITSICLLLSLLHLLISLYSDQLTLKYVRPKFPDLRELWHKWMQTSLSVHKTSTCIQSHTSPLFESWCGVTETKDPSSNAVSKGTAVISFVTQLRIGLRALSSGHCTWQCYSGLTFIQQYHRHKKVLENMCKVYSSEPCTPRRLLVLVKRNQLLIHLQLILISRSRDRWVDIAGWKAGVRFSARTKDSFQYSIAPRPALGPTPPPIQLVPGWSNRLWSWQLTSI